MNEIICRLCLQTISGSYETIEQSLENTLKLNVNISKEPVKCIDCTSNLEVFLKFKSSCDNMNEQILSTDPKDDIQLDQETTGIENNLISLVQSKNGIVCCFCRKTSEKGDLTSLKESKEHKFLIDVLKQHIPKLNLNITDDLLTCETCLDELQRVFNFIMKCMNVEQKISKYAEVNGMDDKGQIALRDVQQFTFIPTIKLEAEFRGEHDLIERFNHQFQERDPIRPEGEIKYEIQLDDPELFIKTEEIDINSEQSDCDSCQGPSTVPKNDNGASDITASKPQGRHGKYIDQDGSINENSEVIMRETCSYGTKRKSILRRHLSTRRGSSEVKIYKCNYCSYEAIRMDYLKKHKLVHKSSSGVETFKCRLCSYEAKNHNYMRRHELTHKSASEVKMRKCELCPFETKRTDHLKQHQLVHKSPSEVEMFRCGLCSYETKNRNYIKRHELIHKSASEITMFRCGLCQFETKRQDTLKRHRLTHRSVSEPTNYKCKHCAYEAKRIDHLKNHELLHESLSEVKIFRCELCPYETTIPAHSKRHKSTHNSTP